MGDDMPLPEYGKWRLKHPLFGANPPFPILEVDLLGKSGSAGLNLQWYPLLYVHTRPGDSEFMARYRVGANSGVLIANYQEDQSLKVTFNGSVDATCDGQLIEARGLIQGTPSEPPADIKDVAGFQIHCAGDIARWFDGLVMENEHELKRLCDNYARRNPDSWIAVGLANSAKDLYSVMAHQGQGLVDALRIGEGCHEGGWGIGKDALRALAFLPAFRAVRPLAREVTALRGAGRAAPAARTAAAEAGFVRPTAELATRRVAPVPPPMPRPLPPAPKPLPALTRPASSLPGPLAKDPGGGVCWAVATVNAVQLLRGRFWMTVGKLFRAVDGTDLWQMKALNPNAVGAHLREVRTVLDRFGIFMCELGGVKKLISKGDDIFELVKNSPAGSVVLFSVQWAMKTGGKTENVAHALVAWKDPAGTVYIIDRESEAAGKIFRSFAELDKLGYDGIANCVIQTAFRLENCTGGFVREAGKLVFAIGFTTTLTVNAVETQQTPQPR